MASALSTHQAWPCTAAGSCSAVMGGVHTGLSVGAGRGDTQDAKLLGRRYRIIGPV